MSPAHEGGLAQSAAKGDANCACYTVAMKRRGVGIGTALLVALLVLTLALAVSSLGVTHLQLLSRSGSAHRALDAAQSVVSLATERAIADPEFGLTQDRALHVDLPSGGTADLSFDGTPQVPASVNNIRGTGTVLASDGRRVPLHSVLLVGVGNFGGCRKVVRCLVSLPPFPYAAAADGPISSAGRLVVGEIPASGDTGQLQPAHLLSNARGPAAVRLGPDSTVHGDVRAAGKITLDRTVVLGQVKPDQPRELIPRIRLLDFDPKTMGKSYRDLRAALPGEPTMRLSGALRHVGNRTLKANVELAGGLVFVDGDLTIEGGLNGQGLVITTGKLKILGQTRVEGEDKLALLSGKKLSLLGSDRVSAQIRGVVYTEGGLEAKRISTRGALVASQGDAVSLEDASLYQDGPLTHVSIVVGSAGGTNQDIYLHATPPTNSGLVLCQASFDYDPAPNIPHAPGWTYDSLSFHPLRNADGSYSGVLSSGAGAWSQNVGPAGSIADLVSQLNNLLNSQAGPYQWHVDENHMEELISLSAGTQTVTEPEAPFQVVVDPNELLPLEKRARVLLWQEGSSE